MTKQPVQFPFNGGPQQGRGIRPPLQTFSRDPPPWRQKHTQLPLSNRRSRFYFLPSDPIVLSRLTRVFIHASRAILFIRGWDQIVRPIRHGIIARATGIVHLWKGPTVTNRYRCNSIFFFSFRCRKDLVKLVKRQYL